MSDLENPYQSPETQIVPEAKQFSGVELTVNMIKYLNEASPWLRFVGILGYISCGFTVLIGIIFIIVFAAAGSLLGLPSEFAWLGGVFAFYIPLGVLVFFPAHYTFTFGQKIRRYKFTNSIDDLEQAFKNNKSLWKFSGILCIVSLAITPVMTIITVIVSVVSAVG